METLIISAENFYDCSNFNRKKGALVLTTLPRSSIRRTIFIPNFCADAHFLGMALNLSPSFTLQMMEILLVMMEIILVIRFPERIFATCNSFPFQKCHFQNFKNFSFLKTVYPDKT